MSDRARSSVRTDSREGSATADAEPAGVTVSLGVAASRGDDPRGLLESADARLYVAKEAGRNRVVAS